MLKPSVLNKYIVEEAVEYTANYLNVNEVKLIITNHRVTKLGTFYVAPQTRQCTITINGTLNKHHFLLVILHEFAHLEVYKQYKRRMQPHGKEWKRIFGEFINRHIAAKHFPEDLSPILTEFACNPPAAFNRRSKMGVAIAQYYDPDNPYYNGTESSVSDSIVRLKDIPVNTVFFLKNGMRFRKGELPPRSRVRYVCLRLQDNRKFLVHADAEVTPV